MEEINKIIQSLIDKIDSDKIVWRKGDGMYENSSEYKRFKVFKVDGFGENKGALYFQCRFITVEKELFNSIEKQIARRGMGKRQSLISKMKRILNIK